MRFEDLPYRPCVGVVVFNRDGRAFIGRRIDGNEDPWRAALRELREETNIRSVERLGEIADWLRYDIPRELIGQAWKGKYRGQTQKWFALRFTGDDSEIDPFSVRNDQPAEFDSWRWERLDRVADLVVPFRRQVYREVARQFAKFVG